MIIPKWKKSATERWIKIKIKGNWEKIIAPAFEKEIKIWLQLMKIVLTKRFGFKIEERNEKTIHKRLLDLRIKDETLLYQQNL
jgi:hypothetical protein